MSPQFFFFITFLLFLFKKTSSNNVTDTCTQDLNDSIEYYSNDLPVIVIDYNDLIQHKNVQTSISIAYGKEGLGILLVKNVPNLKLKREKLLTLSRQLGLMNEENKTNIIHEPSFYSVGWSHGKEKLSHNQPDYSKGSFYANPIIDDPTNNNTQLIHDYPAFYYPNIWPTNTIPTLRESFMDLGTLIYQIGTYIAEQMDNYTHHVRNGYEYGTIKNMISTPLPKGRLLYYYSINEMKIFSSLIKNETNEKNNQTNNSNENKPDSWCGWHNDHSALTGLALGMYFDENGNILENIKDERCGLYIKTRTNKIYRMHLNENEASSYLAYQIGETSQIISGGALLATPHSVHGPHVEKFPFISRASFAIFMQPNHLHHMRAPYDCTLQDIQLNRYLPDNIPTLASRWCNDSSDTFGEFTRRTLSSYY